MMLDQTLTLCGVIWRPCIQHIKHDAAKCFIGIRITGFLIIHHKHPPLHTYNAGSQQLHAKLRPISRLDRDFNRNFAKQ